MRVQKEDTSVKVEVPFLALYWSLLTRKYGFFSSFATSTEM